MPTNLTPNLDVIPSPCSENSVQLQDIVQQVTQQVQSVPDCENISEVRVEFSLGGYTQDYVNKTKVINPNKIRISVFPGDTVY